MSRDAKVGLVIVFAFVFLLGTILLHRLHSTDSEAGAGGLETAAVDVSEGPDNGNSLPGEDFPSARSGTVTTVDGVSADTMMPQRGGGGNPPLDTTFPSSQRVLGQQASSRPPVEIPANPESGAHISLTDPHADRQPAAVVEPAGGTQSVPEFNPRTSHVPTAEPPEGRAEMPGRSPPLLEIPGHAPKSGRNNAATSEPPIDREMEPEIPTRDLDTNPPDVFKPPEGVRGAATEPPAEEPDSSPQPPAGRHASPFDRTPTVEPNEKPDEMEPDPDAIRQAAGKRRPEPEDTLPPRLPKFGNPTQATVESVPDRDANSSPFVTERSTSRPPERTKSSPDPIPSANRTPPKSGQGEDAQLSGQRTYVVKEGDSFWSISAKFYQTGKYFRGLEEFNRDRLSASPGGGKVLKPGMVVVVPDEAELKPKSSAKRTEVPASKPDRLENWREDNSGLRQSRSENYSPPRSERSAAPGTYRVQEGDTLSTIAQRELGSAKRWQEIYQLNREKLCDEHVLKIGMDLKMPPAQAAEKVSARPNF